MAGGFGVLDFSIDPSIVTATGGVFPGLGKIVQGNADESPSTPSPGKAKQKGALRNWLSRRTSHNATDADLDTSSPKSPASTKEWRRSTKGGDYGAPEMESGSQSSVLRTRDTDRVITSTQDVVVSVGEPERVENAENVPENTHSKEHPNDDDAPHQETPTQSTEPPPPRPSAEEDAASTTTQSSRPGIRGRLLHALSINSMRSGRHSSVTNDDDPHASTSQAVPETDDVFSTEQSHASSSALADRSRASGNAATSPAKPWIMDGMGHAGSGTLLGRVSSSSRSTTSQASGLAAFVGRWRKNMDESNTGVVFEELLDMPRLQRMVRQRVTLLEIKDAGDGIDIIWHVRLNGGKEILKSESYPKDGTVTECPRKDGRDGHQRSIATLVRGTLHIKSVQGDPYAAMFHDRFGLSTRGNRLRIEHKLQLMLQDVAPVRYVTIWSRMRDGDDDTDGLDVLNSGMGASVGTSHGGD